MESTDTYLVAVKRSKRESAPSDWAAQLEELEGVESETPPANPRRIQIRATEAGLARVREALGEFCHIEPVVLHRPLATPPKSSAKP